MNSIVIPKVTSATTAGSDIGHWQARLALQFGMTAAGCRLLRTQHQGPLYVQRAFYPEGPELAHVYLLHPPGGLVSGDELRITLTLAADTAVLCTTPGAGRLYRARSDQRLQQQVNTLQVAAGASLEWFPQETLVYRGAVASLETRVELADDARFIGWELIALGLPASGIKFDDGSFTQRFVISRNGLPLLIERMHIEGSSLTFRAGMAALQGHSLSGTFVCGPFADKMLDDSQIAALRERLQLESGALAALTVLGEFVVLRYLGSCSEEARRCFVRCWEYLRPLLLQRAACAPRIWAT